MSKLPANVQAAIRKHHEERERVASRSENLRNYTDKKQTELAEAKAELSSALSALADDPSDANAKAELKARRKVADLEMQLSGNNSVVDEDKTRELAIEAVKLARSEAESEFTKKEPAKLDATKAAKKAYLEALQDYRENQLQALVIFAETVRETGISDRDRDAVGQPRFTEFPLFYTGGNPNQAGLFDGEILKAFKNGEIDERYVI